MYGRGDGCALGVRLWGMLVYIGGRDGDEDEFESDQRARVGLILSMKINDSKFYLRLVGLIVRVV